MLNLKREIGLQVKGQKLNNITEAQNQVLEMEIRLKESQSLRQTQITQPTANTRLCQGSGYPHNLKQVAGLHRKTKHMITCPSHKKRK